MLCPSPLIPLSGPIATAVNELDVKLLMCYMFCFVWVALESVRISNSREWPYFPTHLAIMCIFMCFSVFVCVYREH